MTSRSSTSRASFVACRSWRWRPTTARRSSDDTIAEAGNQFAAHVDLPGAGDADQHDQARVGQPQHRLTLAHPSSMIGSMILTTRCAGCDRPGAPLCRTCRFALVGRVTPPAPPGVLVAAPFTGRVRDVLLGFKYRNRRAVAGHLAGLLVNRVAASGRRVDVVTWAPTSARRRHQRGFDQAELVARHVARQLGVPCRRLLERQGPGRSADRARTASGRLHGPAFRAHPRVEPVRVLVVDDVVTTGATLEAAATALRQAGAAEVTCAAVAATPFPDAAGARVA